MDAPRISVIIPSYGRPSILDDCIQRIAEQDYPSFEIVLVHQGTPHPQYDHEALRMVALDEAIGSTDAKNRGIAAAEGDILVFVDDDILPQSETWLRQFADEFQIADSGVGAIGGFIDEPNPFAGEEDTGTIQRNALGFYRFVSNFQTEERREVDHLKIGNTAVKREVFDQLRRPYFDPVFGGNAHREESDFFLRVRDAGFRMVYTPQCAVTHLQADTGGQRAALSNRSLRSAWWTGRNEAILFRRHFHTGPASTATFVLQEAIHNRLLPHKQFVKIWGGLWGLLLPHLDRSTRFSLPEQREAQ